MIEFFFSSIGLHYLVVLPRAYSRNREFVTHMSLSPVKWEPFSKTRIGDTKPRFVEKKNKFQPFADTIP